MKKLLVLLFSTLFLLGTLSIIVSVTILTFKALLKIAINNSVFFQNLLIIGFGMILLGFIIALFTKPYETKNHE